VPHIFEILSSVDAMNAEKYLNIRIGIEFELL
jgi:hypothetical protein